MASIRKDFTPNSPTGTKFAGAYRAQTTQRYDSTPNSPVGTKCALTQQAQSIEDIDRRPTVQQPLFHSLPKPKILTKRTKKKLIKSTKGKEKSRLAFESFNKFSILPVQEPTLQRKKRVQHDVRRPEKKVNYYKILRKQFKRLLFVLRMILCFMDITTQPFQETILPTAKCFPPNDLRGGGGRPKKNSTFNFTKKKTDGNTTDYDNEAEQMETVEEIDARNRPNWRTPSSNDRPTTRNSQNSDDSQMETPIASRKRNERATATPMIQRKQPPNKKALENPEDPCQDHEANQEKEHDEEEDRRLPVDLDLQQMVPPPPDVFKRPLVKLGRPPKQKKTRGPGRPAGSKNTPKVTDESNKDPKSTEPRRSLRIAEEGRKREENKERERKEREDQWHEELKERNVKWRNELSEEDNKLRQITEIYLHDHPQPTVPLGELPKIKEVATNHFGQTFNCHNRKPGDKRCASRFANHEVPYENSGQIEYPCPFCGKLLLKSEYDKVKKGQWAKCCAYGDVHTETMQREDIELMGLTEEMKKRLAPTEEMRERMGPDFDLLGPPQKLFEIACQQEPSIRNNFYKNTLPLNNSMAFGTMTCGTKTCETRKDVCVLNNDACYRVSDLLAPEGKTPLFGQMYCIDPDVAAQLKFDNLIEKNIRIKKEIVEWIEVMLRSTHPFAKTYKQAAELHKTDVESVEQNGGKVPSFRLFILSNRELQQDVIKQAPGVKKIICKAEERTNEPVANQIAVIWLSEEGEAPDFKGIWLDGHKGRVVEYDRVDGNPNIDPLLFPLLFPRGTQGFRGNLKKNHRQPKEKDNDQPMDADKEDVEFLLNGQGASDNETIDSMRDDLLDQIGDENYDDRDAESDHDDVSVNEDEGDDNVMIQTADTTEKKKKQGPETNISMRQFWRYRMFYNKQFVDDQKKKHGLFQFHWLWSMRKLAEYFVITVLNRIEHNEMKWVKLNQQNLRQILAKEYIDAISKGLPENGTLGKVFMAPRTFHGSRKFYQQSYADLMTLVRTYGHPTWFLTFTGNPSWPELKQELFEGQDHVHRPDVVCRYFIDKVTKFVQDIVVHHVLGKVKAWTYSVEHQKAGMPHIHFLVVMEKDQDLGTAEYVDQYVCTRIPQLPDKDDFSPEARQQRRLWYLVTKNYMHDCESGRMCRVLRVDATGNEHSFCTRRFPKAFTPKTVISTSKYTDYQRLPPEDYLVKLHNEDEDVEAFDDRDEDLNPSNDPDNGTQYTRCEAPEILRDPHVDDSVKPDFSNFDYSKHGLTYFKMYKGKTIPRCLTDADVVGYNPFLTLKYGCHINIEYVFGQKACKYIFKYLLKGHESAYVKVAKSKDRKDGKDVYDYDEISALFKVRYMTSMEAYLRLLGYPIVKSSHNFAYMTVHTEDTKKIVFEEGKEDDIERKVGLDSKLTGFFKLCSRKDQDGQFARKFRYDEIELYFWWDRMKRKWIRRKVKKGNKWVPRTQPMEKLLIRVYTVSAKNAERYACRLLLLNRKGPKSFEDLRTVDPDDGPENTYVEAAKRLGLMHDDALWIETMRDAICEKMNENTLIRYFARLLFHQPPQDAKGVFEQLLDEILPPRVNTSMTKDDRRKRLLYKMEYILRQFGGTCQQLGLIEGDEPEGYDEKKMQIEMDEDELLALAGGDVTKKKTWRQLLDERLTMMDDNEPQRDAYLEIVKTLINNNSPKAPIQRCFFLEGPGGCGKTFLYNTLIYKMKSQNAGVISCASTGIAALLLLYGMTAHRAFYVPVDVESNTKPTVKWESAFAQKLRDAKLIIIDEVSMMNREVLEYINRVLQDVVRDKDGRPSNVPFGGKVVVIGGDWKQLLPVVPGASVQEQAANSVKFSPLFKEFKVLRLSKNMRADKDQKEFADWLCEVGTGRKNDPITNELQLDKENLANSVDELINFCFGDLFKDPLNQTNQLADAAILAPTNDNVKYINERAMRRIKGQERKYLSIDEPLDNDVMNELGIYNADQNIEAINHEMPTGMPPHELVLKVGAPIMLIKNLDIPRGLCNGTRLQVLKMERHHLVCKILTGPNAGQTEYIPQITLKHGEGNKRVPIKFKRTQFPVRPCFAMTVNKSQGQTLKRVGLCLDKQQCFGHGQIYVAFSRVTRMDGIKVFTRFPEGRVQNFVYQPILEDGDRCNPDDKAIQDALEKHKLRLSKQPVPITFDKPLLSPTNYNVTELDNVDMCEDDPIPIDLSKVDKELLDFIRREEETPTLKDKTNNDEKKLLEIVEEQKQIEEQLKPAEFIVPLPPTRRSTRHLNSLQQPTPQVVDEVIGQIAPLRNLSKRLRQYVLTNNFIEGDGNCFFRALSYQLYGTQEHHLRIRQEMALHITQLSDYGRLNTIEYLRNHLMPQDRQNFSKYQSRIRERAAHCDDRNRYGGDVEAALCSKRLNRNIIVVFPQDGKVMARLHRPDDQTLQLPHYQLTNENYDAIFDQTGVEDPLVIYFNGVNHYEVIRRKS